MQVFILRTIQLCMCNMCMYGIPLLAHFPVICRKGLTQTGRLLHKVASQRSGRPNMRYFGNFENR